MTITYPNLVKRDRQGPPKFIAEHRAGKFFVYNDCPIDVVKAISKRVLPVREIRHDGYFEIHAWSPDFEPGVVAGQELPHYRWMYDTDTLALTCVKESPKGAEDGLRQEDPPRIET